MCDKDWVVVGVLVNFTYSQGQLGSVPCLLRVATLKRLLGVEDLRLHLELYRVAFPKINGIVKSTEEGKENYWNINNNCVLTVPGETFLPLTYDYQFLVPEFICFQWAINSKATHRSKLHLQLLVPPMKGTWWWGEGNQSHLRVARGLWSCRWTRVGVRGAEFWVRLCW